MFATFHFKSSLKNILPIMIWSNLWKATKPLTFAVPKTLFPDHEFEQSVITTHLRIHITRNDHNVTFRKPLLDSVELFRELSSPFYWKLSLVCNAILLRCSSFSARVSQLNFCLMSVPEHEGAPSGCSNPTRGSYRAFPRTIIESSELSANQAPHLV